MKYLLLLLACLPNFLHAEIDHEHPRSIISREDVALLRDKVKRQPFNAMYNSLEKMTLEQQSEQKSRPYDPYADGDLMANQAYLYLLSGDQDWAAAAWVSAQRVLEDSAVFYNPLAKGLTRARLLKNLALAYDFCYDAWDEAYRKFVNKQLFELMESVNATMGFSANYNIESNWMGVRFGSVVLASFVWDAPSDAFRTPEKPLQWDATKRLKDHLDASIFTNGWNGESMSYHIYGWTFVGPALLALQQNLSSFSLQAFAPQTTHSLHGLMTSTVAIEHKGNKGIQADLSDDDMMFNTGGVLSMAFRLYPEEQLGALKWMHDYLIRPEDFAALDGSTLFYSIVYYPEKVEAQNPAEIGWLTYHDPQQGIVITRNRFLDENDIVTTYNAKQTRIRGHGGPDANTFRMVGLGVPWVIGGGRTGLTAGQTQLFPVEAETAEKGNKGLGLLHDFEFMSKRSYAIGSGSSVGTQDHQRKMLTSFEEATQAEAIVIIADSSANGKRWRINTPEFNDLQKTANGYLLHAPNGSSMRVAFIGTTDKIRLEEGKVRYGGNTQDHNLGIWYQNEVFAHSRYIDFYCDGNVIAVISLQAKGKDHPPVSFIPEQQEINVGELEIKLPLVKR